MTTTTEPQKHLPLTGEENPDQIDLAGRVYKRATSSLLIERATQYAEALDELAQAKANVDSRKDDLDAAFRRLKEQDQFVDASTMAGSTYRFFRRSDTKVVTKVLATPKAQPPQTEDSRHD